MIRFIWNKLEIVKDHLGSTVPQTKKFFLSSRSLLCYSTLSSLLKVRSNRFQCGLLALVVTKLLRVVFKYPVYAEWTEIRNYGILYTLLPVLLFGALVCANANQVQW